MTNDAFPEPPEVPESRRGSGSSFLRFEDVVQDGRVRLEGVWPAIGPILWGKMDVAATLHRLAKGGIRSVLSYVEIEGGSEPVSVRARAEHEVRWRLGHTVDERGELNRIVFDTWLLSHAPRGVPDAPGLPPASEQRVPLARAYGQHVFTRPTAPPGAHRVLDLDEPAFSDPRAERVPFHDAAGLLRLPADAEPLDPAPRPDAAPIVFGLCHTDGNQHVNFLAYPRLAEEAALRRFRELSLDARRLARRASVAYRKPCFAGDAVRTVTQAFRQGDALGVLVAFLPESEAAGRSFADWSELGRPHVAARIWFPA
jgi:hypothetical protein